METENVMIFNHPLINHKIAILRDKETSMKEFREIVEEIASIMAYEAFRDAPTKQVEVETPLEKTTQTVLQEDKIVIVPILRAGLGMVNGIHTVLPNARVGHIGMYRDEETMQPKEYYAKFPDHIEDKIVVLLDPMLATGGSACDAISLIKKRGAKQAQSRPCGKALPKSCTVQGMKQMTAVMGKPRWKCWQQSGMTLFCWI